MDANRESVGVLVVGAGFLGSQRAAAACIARGTTLIGVADVDIHRAGAIAARHGAFAVGSLEEGLLLDGVDAVVVATPHADHVESVELALACGKHVLCEKPLAIDADDARRLALQADEARLCLAVGFNHRFYPPIREAIGIVEAGGLGRVEGLRIQIGHHASQEFLRGWHTDVRVSGGGTLIDNGVHACDLIRRIAGEVESVSGNIRHDPRNLDTCERDAFGLFLTLDDVVAELHSSWNLRRGYLTVDIRGDAGWLIAETAPWRLSGRLAEGRRLSRGYLAERIAERLHRRRFGCERSLVAELEAFAGAIRGEIGPGGNSEDGCRATEMVLGLYESARLRAEVPLAPRVAGGRGGSPQAVTVRGRTGGRA
ncbi:MAG TPA: Gfo/Idh/MocA family oxidoreductase [Isosphaeraceae bacterium]|nr:Gfo/Idh/MocA family oxidoreductase [Isosphaeraceae bacterium]